MSEAMKAIKRKLPTILKIHVHAPEGINPNINAIKRNGRIKASLGNSSKRKATLMTDPIIPKPEERQPSVVVVFIDLVYFYGPQYLVLLLE